MRLFDRKDLFHKHSFTGLINIVKGSPGAGNVKTVDNHTATEDKLLFVPTATRIGILPQAPDGIVDNSPGLWWQPIDFRSGLMPNLHIIRQSAISDKDT